MKHSILLVITILFLSQISFGQTVILDNTNISGNWTLANSPYIINGRAIIQNGQTLTIDPGVEVRLRSSASQTPAWFNFASGNVGVIRVKGEIIANGTTTNPIVFTRDNTGYWGTILIDENTISNSSFNHCIIEYGKETRNVTGISSPISFDGGISVYKTAINMSENEIRNNRINGVYIRESDSSINFTRNALHTNGSNGLVIDQSYFIGVNNSFYNNSNSATGLVSAIRSTNSVSRLDGNLIYNNDDLGMFTTNGGSNTLVNNTIYGNRQGIRIENGANTLITNSIIQNNTINFATNNVIGASIAMQFSLTNDSTFPANVVNQNGNILNTNALFTNPATNDFTLQSLSPCIDAGDPNTTRLNLLAVDFFGNPRINNAIIDIGAAEFQQPIASYTVTTSAIPLLGGTTSGNGSYLDSSNVTVIATENSGYTFLNWTENGVSVSTQKSYGFTIVSNRNLVANFDNTVSLNESELDINNLRIYPNPTKSLINIDLTNLSLVEVYDFQGLLISKHTEGRINLIHLPQGVYLLKIYTSKGEIVNKRIVKQ